MTSTAEISSVSSWATIRYNQYNSVDHMGEIPVNPNGGTTREPVHGHNVKAPNHSNIYSERIAGMILRTRLLSSGAISSHYTRPNFKCEGKITASYPM